MSNIYLLGKSNALFEAIDYTKKNFSHHQIKIVPAESDLEVDNWQYSIKKYCKNKKLSTCKIEDIYDDANAVIISIQYDRILKPKLFKSKKIFNIHFSLLPKYKGVYPAIWPILNGETESGVTLHYIDSGIDTGDIIDQIAIAINEDDTARDLYYKCIDAAAELYKKQIKNLLSGNYFVKKQPKTNSIYYSKNSIDFANIKFDLNQTAWQIHNQLRGMNFREFQLPQLFEKKIFKSELLDKKSYGKPGTLIENPNESFAIINTIDYQLKVYFDWYETLFDGCVEENYELVKSCLIHIDNLEITSKNGWTALMMAAYYGQIDICKLLLERGANVNATNYKGTSVFMYAKNNASKTSKTTILELLLDYGALLEHKDKEGLSVIDYANIENNPLIIKFIEGKL
jgi:methionyl-tRNA formyltransferase